MPEFNPFGQLMEVRRYKENLAMKQDQIARQNAIQTGQLNQQAQDRSNAMYQGTQAREAAQRRQMGLEMTLGNVPPERRQEELVSRGYLKEAAQLKQATPKAPTVSGFGRMIMEREELAKKLPPDHKIIQAYDQKISGTDINAEELDDNTIEVFGNYFNLTGRMPSLGRGKSSTAARIKIINSAAKQAGSGDRPAVNLADAASSMVGSQADVKGITSSIGQQNKQLGAMRSFVINMKDQIGRVGKLAKELETFDSRLLNVPLRSLRGRWAGSAKQAIYDLYLTEIEGEAGKLATGSAASVAELSQGAQEKWAQIHDKNLSVGDMLEVLKETGHAGDIRINSVKEALDVSKKELRNVGKGKQGQMQGWSIKKVQ